MDAQDWFGFPERDEDWQREAWRETVRAVVVTEQRAFIANVLAWLGMCVAAWFMSNPAAFILPLTMRLLALSGSRLSWNHIRRRLDRGQPLEPAMKILTVMLFFGGMSWAFLLIPLIDEPAAHPARMVIGGGTLIAVAMITSMIAPLRTATIAYAGGFALTIGAGLLLAPADLALPAAAGLSMLFTAILIYAFANARQRQFAADMLVENRRLSERLTEALAHSEFMAVHDPLTGLFNRRALFERGLVDRATNDRAHLLVVDLDHFKQLNDSYGHDMGDKALIAAAALMRDALRAHSPGEHFAVRLGGEEFGVFLDEADEERTLQFAEDLREGLARLHDELGLPQGATSASIGVAQHLRGEAVATSLLRADAAMYDAKAEGRNRVRREDR
ncbi:GGDEF domain-containing protein [Erythrobacter mangrovi]|uniref:diguanylate cyclase n=1 Tax=Erythrobacter mangrovi TaxID=2739433 RepID=A0A7D3XAM3_9SPHN|nr:GGDEF domain-containing protein [Erythrobacter mangrovi]QKG71895.1 GGDEF domain-containing protein [Erythrobacter mangrovi]